MAETTCAFPSCVKPARCRGWCSAHYERWRKHGDPGIVLDPVPPPRPERTQPETCTVDGCGRRSWARSLCDGHYQKLRKHGDPLADHRRRRLTCSVDDCGRVVHGHGWCKAHYMRWRMHGDPLWTRPTYTACTVEGCARPSRNDSNPMCEAHYCRLWRNGTLELGQCSVCQGPLPPESPFGRRFCESCRLDRRRDRGRDAVHRRRVAMTGADAERIDSREIYERDHWRCGVCRKRADRRLQWPHPMSPSLDHVVPIADGGPHTRANVRLAHLTCNTGRGARGGGEQLALIG